MVSACAPGTTLKAGPGSVGPAASLAQRSEAACPHPAASTAQRSWPSADRPSSPSGTLVLRRQQEARCLGAAFAGSRALLPSLQ